MERELIIKPAYSRGDIPTALIAIFSMLTLIYLKKIKEPQLILVSAIIGIVLKTLL